MLAMLSRELVVVVVVVVVIVVLFYGVFDCLCFYNKPCIIIIK